MDQSGNRGPDLYLPTLDSGTFWVSPTQYLTMPKDHHLAACTHSTAAHSLHMVCPILAHGV